MSTQFDVEKRGGKYADGEERNSITNPAERGTAAHSASNGGPAEHAGATLNQHAESIGAARLRASIVAFAPLVMLAGFFYHPHIGDPVDADFLARLGAAVNADPARWAIAHLLVAVGSPLIVLAFLAIRSRLRQGSEERWSRFAIPFIVIGGTLYAMLPAMEFAPLAAARAGGDAAATQGALLTWFVPVLFTSAAIFVVGAIGFALGIARSDLFGPTLRRVVAALIVGMALARFVPLSAIQLHLQGILAIAAFWPLAYHMWMHPRPLGDPQLRTGST